MIYNIKKLEHIFELPCGTGYTLLIDARVVDDEIEDVKYEIIKESYHNGIMEEDNLDPLRVNTFKKFCNLDSIAQTAVENYKDGLEQDARDNRKCGAV